MTQGDILSALAPLDTLVVISNLNGEKHMSVSDVNMVMPFVKEAKKAAEKLSRFALDHFNSHDENKRVLAKLICQRFSKMHFYETYVDEKKYYYCTIEYYNNYIKSINSLIENTEAACRELVEILPPPSAKEEMSVGKTDEEIVEETLDTTNCNVREEPLSDEVISNEQGGDEVEVERNLDEIEEWNSQNDSVFKNVINPQRVFEKLEYMNDPRVTDDYPRIFVFFKILLFLGWINNHQKNFLKWANLHWKLGWEKDYNFKFGNNIKKELRDTQISSWDENTLPNSDTGKAYRALAKKVLDILTEKVNDNRIIDRKFFYKDGVKERINDGKKLEYPF